VQVAADLAHRPPLRMIEAVDFVDRFRAQHGFPCRGTV
jgi:hypothetical protein